MNDPCLDVRTGTNFWSAKCPLGYSCALSKLQLKMQAVRLLVNRTPANAALYFEKAHRRPQGDSA